MNRVFRRRALRVLAAAGLVGCVSAGAAPRIAHLRPIALHDGVSTVRGFLPDGSSATIVQAWRANGNAHGHHDWLVLAPVAEAHGAAEVTLRNPVSGFLEDTVGDDPFDGERVIGSLRFARGTVDGRPASLLLKATLDDEPGRSLADHETATVRVFRLEATGGDPGDSPLEFREVWHTRTTKRFCNAQLAMTEVLGLPLPPDYAGPNRVDGCFPP